MEFSKIRFKESEGVELLVKLKLDNGAAEARTFTCSTPPLPELPAALKAFVPFVADLLEVPDAWRDELTPLDQAARDRVLTYAVARFASPLAVAQLTREANG
jgi:hypothetical protein